MGTQLQFTETHTLYTRWCWSCRKWWGSNHESRGTCPYCAEDDRRKQLEEERRLVRRINALKGAITRARRAKGRR